MTEKRDNSGSLRRNDRKEKDTHPDYTGSAVIENKEFWINAWLKEKDGKKFFSFSFKAKEASNAKPARQESFGHSEYSEDQIPF